MTVSPAVSQTRIELVRALGEHNLVLTDTQAPVRPAESALRIAYGASNATSRSAVTSCSLNSPLRYDFASASVNSSHIASSDCGITRVPASDDMKFVSPLQRGTKCHSGKQNPPLHHHVLVPIRG